jgi:hypothetical protein
MFINDIFGDNKKKLDEVGDELLSGYKKTNIKEQAPQYNPKGVPLKQQPAPLNVPQGWEAKTQPDGSTRISKQGSMSSAEYKQNMADYKAKNWTPEKMADYSQRMASGQGYTDAERQANLQQQQQHFGKYADTGDLQETFAVGDQPQIDSITKGDEQYWADFDKRAVAQGDARQRLKSTYVDPVDKTIQPTIGRTWQERGVKLDKWSKETYKHQPEFYQDLDKINAQLKAGEKITDPNLMKLMPSYREVQQTNPKGVPIGKKATYEQSGANTKETELTTNQPRTGLSAEQKAQLRKDVDAVDYNKQQQPPAAPSREQKAGIRQAVSDYNKDKKVDEAGPFSYGTKKPRRGSVADLAAKKRKEQERGQQPIEPKDQRVGVAKVVKEFAPSGGGGGRWYSDDQLYEIIGEDWLEAFDVSGDQGNIDLNGERARLFLAQEAEAWLIDRGYRVNVLDVRDDGDSLSWYIQGPLYQGLAEGLFGIEDKIKGRIQNVVSDLSDIPGMWDHKAQTFTDAGMEKLQSVLKNNPKYIKYALNLTYKDYEAEDVAEGGFDIPEIPRAPQPRPEPKNKTVGEGSVQDKLYRRQQELRKKRGAPDPEYYRELKATFDLPDEERFAKAAELKKKYKVSEARKAEANFDVEDLKRLEQIRDLPTLKAQAMALISKPSERPMKPEKVAWFDAALDRMDNRMAIIKLMYDLLLSGEGHQVIGSKRSMNPNSYRSKFGESTITNEDVEKYVEELERAGYEIVNEKRMTCPECGGAAYADEMLAEKQDACYHKVKSRYKVWPSAYASGALVRCRKKGAKNWGNKSKK